MPKEREVPYVASGFREDAERLLNRFVERKSLVFADFAAEWRKLKFSLIFMGKENKRELVEFTEECYRNTILFMNATDPLQKVGAVYLLYSLYFKQPLQLLKQVPVKICMCLKDVCHMFQLESYFEDDEGADLAYIIKKLFITEAIHICYCTIPMGPAVPIPLLKLAPLRRDSCFKDALDDLNLFNEKDIKDITTQTEQYEKLKKAIPVLVQQSIPDTQSMFRFKAMKQTLGELETRYNAGLLPNKVDGDVKLEDKFRALGQRRAYLKAQQYGKAAEVGQSRRAKERSDDSPSRNSSPPLVPAKRPRGRPKMKKQRGRKKKVVEVQSKQRFGVANVAECLLGKPGPSGVPGKKPKKGPKPGHRHYFEDDEE